MKDIRKRNFEKILTNLKESNKKISFFKSVKNGIKAFVEEIKSYKEQKKRLKIRMECSKKIFEPILSDTYQIAEESEMKLMYKNVLTEIRDRYLNGMPNKNVKNYIDKYVFTKEYEDLFNYLNTEEAFSYFKIYCNMPYCKQYKDDTKILTECETNVKLLEFITNFEKYISLINKIDEYGQVDDYSKFKIEYFNKDKNIKEK